MNYLIGFLNDFLGDPELAGTAFLLLIAGGVFLLAVTGFMLFSVVFDPLRRRVASVSGQPLRSSATERIGAALAPVAGYVLPRAEGERDRTRLKLIHAGYRSPGALTVFYATKMLLALLLPLVALVAVPLFGGVSAGKLALIAFSASAVGLLGPNYWLARRVRKRQHQIGNGLPDALDLLVVCTEAGYGLKQALQRVSDEISVSHSELGEELALVNAEIRAGVDSATALQNLGERTGLEDIRGLVTLLTQSLRFGTSIAQALRVYSDEFREKRMQRAEERAATIGTRMIFPMIFCIFPSFFLVTVGPPILGVLAMFSRGP